MSKLKICRKDSEKIELLYEKYKVLMYLEAKNILNDAHLAEDAVHQSFMRIINNLNKIDENDEARTRSFLVIICRNVAIDIFNSRNKKNPNTEYIDALENDETENNIKAECPSELVISKETTNRIVKAIEGLPVIYRDAILLEKFHNYSKKEIATLLNTNYETVKKRIERGKKMLAEILSKEGLM